MKRLCLFATLMLGSIIGANLQPTSDFLEVHVSTISTRENVVKQHILERISHVSLIKFFTKKTHYYLGGATVFPVKCVKVGTKFETYYLGAAHTTRRDWTTVDAEIVSNYSKKYGVGFQIHRIYRDVKFCERMLNDDISLVKVVTDEKIPIFSLEKREPRILESIYSVGYPGNVNLFVTDGIVSGPWYIDNKKNWKMSAPIWFGKSGGPVISKHTGKVIGLVVGMIRDGTTSLPNFTIFAPMSQAYDWLEKLLNKV